MRQSQRAYAEPARGARQTPVNSGAARAVHVLVVERDRMARLGLSQVLSASAGIQVSAAVGMIREAEYLPPSTVAQVILVGADVSDMDGVEGIDRLLTRFAGARVVVLALDTSPVLVTAALRQGADGYLPRDIAADALVRALRGVAHGEVAVPRALLSVLVDALRVGGSRTIDEEGVASLSARERDVLTEIARGRSNAEIATRLGLKESTVKTHVSNILRKTGARSRFALHGGNGAQSA